MKESKNSVLSTLAGLESHQITLRLNRSDLDVLSELSEMFSLTTPPFRSLQSLILHIVHQFYIDRRINFTVYPERIHFYPDFFYDKDGKLDIQEMREAFALPQKFHEKRNKNRRLKNGKKDNNIHDIR